MELGEEEYPYNTAYYLEDGKVVHKHRKVYLPTYGAYQEGRNFMAGDKVRAFDTKFGRLGILICEDVWHQSTQYILAQDGAKYVFILFNSPAVVGKRKEELSEGWKTIIKTNSLLNGVYSVAVNRVGVEDGTAFIWKLICSGTKWRDSSRGRVFKRGFFHLWVKRGRDKKS